VDFSVGGGTSDLADEKYLFVVFLDMQTEYDCAALYVSKFTKIRDALEESHLNIFFTG
jgi:hypothetical protein